MPKRILLTRSKEDNKLLREILTPKGYDCIECSLIEHINLPFNPAILDEFTDVIITSKRAAHQLPVTRDVKNVWVVGNSSAEILRDKNYNIKYIASSASELKAQISINIHKGIYLSGNHITVKMPSTVKIMEVYQVSYKDKLSNDEIKLLNSGLEYIILYSENCAKALIKLIVEKDLLKYIENAVVIAISSKVERIVKDYFKKTVACNCAAQQILEKLEEYDRKT